MLPKRWPPPSKGSKSGGRHRCSGVCGSQTTGLRPQVGGRSRGEKGMGEDGEPSGRIMEVGGQGCWLKGVLLQDTPSCHLWAHRSMRGHPRPPTDGKLGRPVLSPSWQKPFSVFIFGEQEAHIRLSPTLTYQCSFHHTLTQGGRDFKDLAQNNTIVRALGFPGG